MTDQAHPLSHVLKQYRLIHDVYVQLDDGDRRVLRGFGLSTSQYAILKLLDPEVGRRPIDLSGTLLRARSTVTRLIDQMEKAGLVWRIPDPDDRRAQLVILTPDGVDLLGRARKAHEQSLLDRLGRMNTVDNQQLNALLEKVRHHLAQNLDGS